MKIIKQNWFTLIAGIMLLLAIPPIWTYSYYQILRWVVSGVACYNAYRANEEKETRWLIIMVVIAILFNPIATFHFAKGTWVILNLVASILMFTSIFKIKKLNEK